MLNSVGSVSASRPELAGQARRLRPLAVAAALGGTAGAVLLLLTPSGAFERIVPFLIAGASTAILRTAIVLLGLVAIAVLVNR